MATAVAEKKEVEKKEDFYLDQAVTDLTNLFRESSRLDMDIINKKFEIGRIVSEVIKKGVYGENAVGNLSQEISAQLGKNISPTRLYEAARFFETFKTTEKIREVEKDVNIPLSYSFIIRNCIPNTINSSNALTNEEIKLHIESKLKRLERSAEEIEELEPNKDSETAGGDDISEQVTGFKTAVKQSSQVSRFIFRGKLKQFLAFLSQLEDVELLQKDKNLVDGIMARLLKICATNQQNMERKKKEAGKQ